MTTTRLLVRQDQLGTTRLDTREDAAIEPGQVRVRIDSFALTANNITYAAFGEAMHYWDFYPSGEPGWGIVPVWGFGTVVQSLHPGVAVGERLYGYWPMANQAVLQPVRLGEAGFSDGSAHRTALHAVYNHYLRCNADPLHLPATEDFESLLRPLFTTSWLIDDFLADNAFFGATTAILSSASSKTAYGTAAMLAQRGDIECVGLTSAAHVPFCESLGCYTRVLAYEELEAIDAGTPCVYVDFAGNVALRRQIHTRFGELKYSCSVGGTHVEQLGGARDVPGPRPVLFFAPAQRSKRQAEWGTDELQRRLAEGWQGFLSRVTGSNPPWLAIARHRGPDEVQSTYAQVLSGGGDPRQGHILSFG